MTRQFAPVPVAGDATAQNKLAKYIFQLQNIHSKRSVCATCLFHYIHYSDNIIATVSLITGVSIVWSTVCPGAEQRKHQSSASLAFVRAIHRWPVDSPHKGPVTQKMFPFDDVIMYYVLCLSWGAGVPVAVTAHKALVAPMDVVSTFTAADGAREWSVWMPLSASMPRLSSLAPGRLKWDISWVIFKPRLMMNGLGVSREIALRWMS